jgi:hypothetical protein
MMIGKGTVNGGFIVFPKRRKKMKWILILIIAVSLFAPATARAESRCLQQGGGDCSNRQEIPACRDHPGGGCIAPNGRYVRQQDAADWRESAQQANENQPPSWGQPSGGRRRPR